MSVVDERLSNDDSSLVFRDKKYCVHHGNDNWFKLRKDNLKRIKNFSKKEFYFMLHKQILLQDIQLLIQT